MKKSILFLLMFATMGLATVAQAQRPGPIGPNLPKPNPGLQNEIQRQAAIKKILDSKVVKMDFVIEKGGVTSISYFRDRLITFQENNNGAFAFKGQLTGPPAYKDGNRTVTYTFTAPPTTAFPQPGLVTSTYKDLLKNGFTASVRFSDRPPESLRVPKGAEWSGDFYCILYFSDGTVVPIAFQDINVGKTGTHKTTHTLYKEKNFTGSVFPDPENPLVLPPVK